MPTDWAARLSLADPAAHASADEVFSRDTESQYGASE
jgi:hypothetical protein